MSDRVPPPRYTGSIVYVCQECFSDLQDEGADHFWCSSCHKSFFFSQIGLYDDGDLDD